MLSYETWSHLLLYRLHVRKHRLHVRKTNIDTAFFPCPLLRQGVKKMEAGEAFISSYSKKLAAIAQEDEARSYDEELRAQGIEPKKRRSNRSQTADVEHEQPHFSWVTFGR